MNLTDTQMVILSAAAQRDDGSIHPLPKTLKGGAVSKVIGALLRKGLIAEAAPRTDDVIGETTFTITAEGALAINVEPADCRHLADTGAQAADGGHDAAPALKTRRRAKTTATGRDGAPRKTREGTKQARLIAMLKRNRGATIAEIVEAFGWQPHTARGAIAGALKKKLGLTVTSEKVEERGRVYHIPR